MPQEKQWWPDEVRDALEQVFGQGSVLSVPMSFAHGKKKTVELSLPSRGVLQAFHTLSRECQSSSQTPAAFPMVEYDPLVPQSRNVARLVFSTDPEIRGKQVEAFCASDPIVSRQAAVPEREEPTHAEVEPDDPHVRFQPTPRDIWVERILERAAVLDEHSR